MCKEVKIVANVNEESQVITLTVSTDHFPEPVEMILMKALEKDPAKRYQSAWEMQFEIVRFLSDNEFTPSNIHLANFLKQVFADELDEEIRRLSMQGKPMETDEGGHGEEERGKERCRSHPSIVGRPSSR